ncbi:ABC transporter permease [Sulfurirhabdus autotrophica]|uniref:Putative ABC transport system permease protein n=1 Tax=Sulfurirhabdus autotrophica TaxID=1706046 RepID=A0A4R3XTZ2_9PROT|nr:FtsX-like permease family protein [Sulfurirhabdus autotrophica]TCV82392.1 putative ABC transport system permease protein [Sulfurirhabdus autotrophica]
MINLLIAARNLTRNRRRAMAALLTVAIGVTSLVLADGFIQWIFWAMREGTIQSQLGHIQVVRPGYLNAGVANPYAFILPEKLPQRSAIESMPGVVLVAPRLSVTGLVSHGETTVAFVADGVDPKKEVKLSKALHIVDGHDLTSLTAKEVLLGRGLARSLNVKPGDTVALLATASGGGMNAVEAKVTGIFTSTNKAYDDAALRLPIGLANSLLRVSGAHAWLVLLNETDRTDAFLAQFRARFPLADNKLEFVPWYQQADFYNKTVALFSKQMNVLRLIIGFIIVLSISNMLVMNVLERTGEIGTLLAIGFKRKKILRLFAIEGILLGFIGATLGLVIGYGLAELISAIGIPMPPPPGMERGFTAEIRVTLNVVMNAFLIAFITTALAGLYPAWKASRLQIINALRHNI